MKKGSHKRQGYTRNEKNELLKVGFLHKTHTKNKTAVH